MEAFFKFCNQSISKIRMGNLNEGNSTLPQSTSFKGSDTKFCNDIVYIIAGCRNSSAFV